MRYACICLLTWCIISDVLAVISHNRDISITRDVHKQPQLANNNKYAGYQYIAPSTSETVQTRYAEPATTTPNSTQHVTLKPVLPPPKSLNNFSPTHTTRLGYQYETPQQVSDQAAPNGYSYYNYNAQQQQLNSGYTYSPSPAADGEQNVIFKPHATTLSIYQQSERPPALAIATGEDMQQEQLLKEAPSYFVPSAVVTASNSEIPSFYVPRENKYGYRKSENEMPRKYTEVLQRENPSTENPTHVQQNILPQSVAEGSSYTFGRFRAGSSNSTPCSNNTNQSGQTDRAPNGYRNIPHFHLKNSPASHNSLETAFKSPTQDPRGILAPTLPSPAVTPLPEQLQQMLATFQRDFNELTNLLLRQRATLHRQQQEEKQIQHLKQQQQNQEQFQLQQPPLNEGPANLDLQNVEQQNPISAQNQQNSNRNYLPKYNSSNHIHAQNSIFNAFSNLALDASVTSNYNYSSQSLYSSQNIDKNISPHLVNDPFTTVLNIAKSHELQNTPQAAARAIATNTLGSSGEAPESISPFLVPHLALPYKTTAADFTAQVGDLSASSYDDPAVRNTLLTPLNVQNQQVPSPIFVPQTSMPLHTSTIISTNYLQMPSESYELSPFVSEGIAAPIAAPMQIAYMNTPPASTPLQAPTIDLQLQQQPAQPISDPSLSQVPYNFNYQFNTDTIAPRQPHLNYGPPLTRPTINLPQYSTNNVQRNLRK